MRVVLLFWLFFLTIPIFAKDLRIRALTYQEFDPVTQYPLVFKYEKRPTTILYLCDQKILRVIMAKPTATSEIKIDTVMYAETAMGEAITFYDTCRRRVLQLLKITIAQHYYTCELLLDKKGRWTQYNYWRCFPKYYKEFIADIVDGLHPCAVKDSANVNRSDSMELLLR